MKVKMILAAAAMVFCAAASNAQEARYEFQKAVITTKTEMMGNPMITTYYIADYGKKEASEFKMDMSAMGGNVMNMRTVTTADGAVSFDINTKEGRKTEGSVNFLNLTPEIVKKHKIVLLTQRDGKELTDAIKWFSDNKIKLYGINDNPQQNTWNKSRKVYADIYIDDRNLGCPLTTHKSLSSKPFVDWTKVEKMLKDQGVI